MFKILFIIFFIVGLFINVWYVFMDYSVDDLIFISVFLIFWLFFILISILPLVFWKKIIWTILSYKRWSTVQSVTTPTRGWRKYIFSYEVEWNFWERKIVNWETKYYSMTTYKTGSNGIFILYDDIFFIKRDLFYFLYFWFMCIGSVLLFFLWVLK